jgi:hypothetical protein
MGSAPAGFEGAPEGSTWFRGRLEGDGWLSDVPSEDVRGDGDPPRCDLGKFVRLFVVPAGHVIKLDAVELVLEGAHGLAVCLHLVVVAACVLHDLVDHELRTPPHVEAFDAYLDGDLEAAEQGLVLGHVVGRREMEAYGVPHVLLEG